MSDALQLEPVEAGPRRDSTRRFPATIGRFDTDAAKRTIDGLVHWVQERFREDLQRRPSKHVYVDKLPAEVVAQVDELRDSPAIIDAMRQHFDPGWAVTPMKHTDELYLSHYNKDLGGDQGLYSKHYDGNLRFVPFGAVVRALIYLQSAGTYKVVFGDSKVERGFKTYEFGLLDFHRELHWVEGSYNPDDPQRILLKCNYLVAPRHAGWIARLVLGANTSVFYVVKAAMEYSKSPSNPVQYVVGLACNFFRVLNNVHPLVPIAFNLAALAAAGWGLLG